MTLNGTRLTRVFSSRIRAGQAGGRSHRAYGQAGGRSHRAYGQAGGRSHRALDDVSITVAGHERVALVGTSGSGKSTLLRLLLAVDTPDSGTVDLDGRPVRPGSPRSLRWFRRAVQYVPQDPAASLDPRRSAIESVAEPLRWLRWSGDRRARAREVLDAVELPASRVDRPTHELSGGQRQRVALARALACGPRLILADEPVSGLDHPLREIVLTVLETACARHDTGLLLVTHDLAVADRLCDRIVVLDNGSVVDAGATSDLLRSPTHPRTRALVDAATLTPFTERSR